MYSNSFIHHFSKVESFDAYDSFSATYFNLCNP